MTAEPRSRLSGDLYWGNTWFNAYGNDEDTAAFPVTALGRCIGSRSVVTVDCAFAGRTIFGNASLRVRLVVGLLLLTKTRKVWK